MDIGIWMIIILLTGLTPTFLALILCLILIKKNPYKKLSKNQIYAGFWQRFLAGIIDLIILIVIEVILIFIPIIGWILSLFVTWLYFAVQHSSTKQATFGMRALDIRITDENHGKIGFWRATGNFYLTVISAFLVFIGFFMIAFTSRKQGFHNLISRTLCIKIK
ncbi:RDD family protein [Candidatus Pelagibacter ubique]|nr:RDD family protein [Candidatus Pelagibacter ubique]